MSDDFVTRLGNHLEVCQRLGMHRAHELMVEVADLRALLDAYAKADEGRKSWWRHNEVLCSEVDRLVRRDSKWRALAKARRTQVRNEQHDVKMLARISSKVFMEVTGGRVSKPNTDADIVIELFEEFLQRECEQFAKDETEALEAELSDAKALLTSIEWGATDECGYPRCPKCEGPDPRWHIQRSPLTAGHKPGCELMRQMSVHYEARR